MSTWPENFLEASEEEAQELIDAGNDVNADSDGYSILCRAVEADQIGHVRMLIDAGAELDGALHIAVANGHLSTAQMLIDAGADVDAADDNDDTPLMLAVENGHSDIAELLIDNDADVNAAREDGSNALDIAVRLNMVELFPLLLGINDETDINGETDNGMTYMELACNEYHSAAFVKMLVNMGADVNQSIEGNPPLLFAIGYVDVEMVTVLLEAGADVRATNSEGETMLRLAYQRREEIEEDFKSYRKTSRSPSTNPHKKQRDDINQIIELLLERDTMETAEEE